MNIRKIIREEVDDFDWTRDIDNDRDEDIQRILKSGWNAPISCITDDGKVQLDKVDVDKLTPLEGGGFRLVFTQWCHGSPRQYTATKNGDRPIIYVPTPIR